MYCGSGGAFMISYRENRYNSSARSKKSRISRMHLATAAARSTPGRFSIAEVWTYYFHQRLLDRESQLSLELRRESACEARLCGAAVTCPALSLVWPDGWVPTCWITTCTLRAHSCWSEYSNV